VVKSWFRGTEITINSAVTEVGGACRKRVQADPLGPLFVFAPAFKCSVIL